MTLLYVDGSLVFAWVCATVGRVETRWETQPTQNYSSNFELSSWTLSNCVWLTIKLCCILAHKGVQQVAERISNPIKWITDFQKCFYSPVFGNWHACEGRVLGIQNICSVPACLVYPSESVGSAIFIKFCFPKNGTMRDFTKCLSYRASLWEASKLPANNLL